MLSESDTTTSNAAEVAYGVQSRVLPLIQAAAVQFEQDLSQLLKDRAGQWVIYHGAKLLGFGGTKTDLLQACYARGYRDEELYVAKIEEEINPSLEW